MFKLLKKKKQKNTRIGFYRMKLPYKSEGEIVSQTKIEGNPSH